MGKAAKKFKKDLCKIFGCETYKVKKNGDIVCAKCGEKWGGINIVENLEDKMPITKALYENSDIPRD